MKTDICQVIQNELPLLVAGVLAEAERKTVLSHLRECVVCREAMRKEASLFDMAAAEGPHNPLNDHPSAEMIDRFARADGDITPDQRRLVAEHTAGCEICRSALALAGALPRELPVLVADEELPIIATAEMAGSSTRGAHGQAQPSRVTPLWVAVGLAAAAALVLISIRMASREPELPTVAVSFAGQMRGEAAFLVVETKAVRSHLTAEVFVDPQPDHHYLWRVVRVSDSSTAGDGVFSDWDQSGYGKFDLSVDTGRYVLDVLDIMEADTLPLVYPFHVRLGP